MLRALVVLAVVVIALLRGGSLRQLADLRLRFPALAIGCFAIQFLIFTPFRATPLLQVETPVLYVASLVLLLAWTVLNRHIPGMWLLMAGLLLNTLAIASNGGYMPVSVEAAAYSGQLDAYPVDGPVFYKRWMTTDEPVQLWLLTDIIAVPAAIPFATVMSIGDLLLVAGICVLCWQTMGGPRALRPSSPPATL
jgi:hypothetical protein